MGHKRGNFKNYIQRLFRKKTSAVEKDTFTRWFSQLDLSDNALTEGEEDAIQEKVRDALQNHAFKTRPHLGTVYSHFWLRSIAAASLIFIGSALYFYIKHSGTAQLVAYQEIHTLKGERKIITLEDGTSIQLNNESRLKYPENFSGKTREVYLSGEAFFRIKHNPSKPFLVHVENLNVQVLGTSFDIKGYALDNNISVTVATGKVGVYKSGEKSSFILLPGDRLSYNSIKGIVTQEKVNPLDEIAWQHGELIFRNEDMETVCRRLERWYGVEFRIRSKALKNKKVNFEIRNDDFNSVMSMLALAGNFRFELKGKTLILTNKK